MSGVEVNHAFVQRLSVWKVLALELVLLFLGATPLTPNIQSDLRHTGFLFRWPFSLWLIVCVAFISFLFVAILPLLWRAVVRLPALEISGDTLTIYGVSGRSFKASEIEEIGPMRFGSLPVKVGGKIVVSIPVFFYVNPDSVLARLSTFRSHRPGLAESTIR
jgi:hypothetical protein